MRYALIAARKKAWYFSQAGDSGSAVFNNLGHVVAIATASNDSDPIQWRGVLDEGLSSPLRARHFKDQGIATQDADETPASETVRLPKGMAITFAAPIQWVLSDIEDFTDIANSREAPKTPRPADGPSPRSCAAATASITTTASTTTSPPAPTTKAPKPLPGTRAFAEERLMHHQAKLREAIEAKRQAEAAVRMHAEGVVLWEKRVAKWAEGGTIEAEMETLLNEARGQEEPEEA
ncbi:hypothetical protein F4777DRAFT_580970 [Nemania sp. FL0916]|nr:hypothetical protein F4777DRAFT_580970 [Nemania sp. FL0916]